MKAAQIMSFGAPEVLRVTETDRLAATGPDVNDYRAGDRVWGMVHPRQRHTIAGAAEYVVVPADRISSVRRVSRR